MPGAITVVVKSNRLPQMPAAIKAAVAAEVSKAAFDIQAQAQAAAPVRTGTLRRSISAQVAGMTARIGPSVDYGIYVEMGARGRAARPFLRPAAEAAFPKFQAAIRAALAGLK